MEKRIERWVKGAAERFKVPESEVTPGLIAHHRAILFVETYGAFHGGMEKSNNRCECLRPGPGTECNGACATMSYLPPGQPVVPHSHVIAFIDDIGKRSRKLVTAIKVYNAKPNA